MEIGINNDLVEKARKQFFKDNPDGDIEFFNKLIKHCSAASIAEKPSNLQDLYFWLLSSRKITKTGSMIELYAYLWERGRTND